MFDNDVFGNSKKLVLTDEQKGYLRGEIHRMQKLEIPPKIYTKTGVKIYENPNRDRKELWTKYNPIDVIIAIAVLLFSMNNLATDGIIPTLLALFFILVYFWLIKPQRIFNFVKIDYENKKIITETKNRLGHIQTREFNFYEIQLTHGHRSNGSPPSIIITEENNEIGIPDSEFGIKSPDFELLREDLKDIEFQNNAWWRNINGVFPDV